MIIGIGTDIASIGRFQENIDKHGERFAGKILAMSEKPYYEQSNQKAQYLASRFAAKEALAKALGTGFRDGLIMPDIAILSNEIGRPYLQLSGKAQELAQSLGVKDLHLSISHEKEFALAFVILSE
jgi:holo-[acyl-carrier protein] synthase